MNNGTSLTNVEFIVDLMNFNNSGALAQVFIIDAIMKRAEAVAEVDPETIDHPLISGHAWVRCAQEIRDRMGAKYGKRSGSSSEPQADSDSPADSPQHRADRLLRQVQAFNDELNRSEKAPDGHDYETLFWMVRDGLQALQSSLSVSR